MQTDPQGKFLFLESIEQFLRNSGINSTIAGLLTFITACLILLLLIWLLDIIGTRVISTVIHAAVRRTQIKWDDFLLERKFYKRLLNFVAASILLTTAYIIFRGFNPKVIILVRTAIQIYLVYMGLRMFNAFVNATNDVYETKPQAKRKSIRSVVQSAKIVAAVIAVILIISIILGRNPSDLLIGLGASAAIITLVFRDTILGFVASVQISAQEMIRPGDWIEMPTKGADGVVTEINVTNVKVRNWDNSMAMIPIYSMVSESFTNWRAMQESDGRRFTRPILIDVNCITSLSDEQIQQIAAHPALARGVARQMLELYEKGNTSPFATNIGLFRCYIEAYLHHHPRVANNQLRVVRYLPNTENGISIQLYAFSIDKTLIDYERVVADIFENVLVVASLFSIRFYQRPLAPAPDAPPLPDNLTPGEHEGLS